MRFMGLDISRAKSLQPVSSRGWFPIVREPYSGAWQKNDEWTVDTVLAYHAAYACITLIANDIGKLRETLVDQDEHDIWREIKSASFSPVMKRPNRYQNHIQFKQWWITSKLTRGNAYALKQRDNRGIVTALYLLDPSRVSVLVSEDGSVFYDLQQDNLSGVQKESLRVPASEIIHDRMNCLFHPLVGVSPLFAAGQAAMVGLNVEKNSQSFFGNGSNPGGILTAPGAISDATAKRLTDYFNDNFTGANSGRVAAVGDGLKFDALRMTSVDAQLIEQLKWSALVVCSAYHVPPYKLGLQQEQKSLTIEAQQQDYYNTCLQILIEEYELTKKDGLGITSDTREIRLDLSGLLRMDTAAQISSLTAEVGGSISTINEARKARNRHPVEGGDSVWMQQQDTSLAALAERDRNGDAFPNPPVPIPVPPDQTDKALMLLFRKDSRSLSNV